MADTISQLSESSDVMVTGDDTALAFASYVPINLMCDKKFV